MRYRMLALDLDGTLLDERGRVSVRNLAAVRRAQEAGLMVVPCTGRGWPESRMALDDVPGLEMGVFVTGAVVNDMATGLAHDLAVVEPHVALELVEFLYDLPEAVLLFRDRNCVGHDYLVTGRGSLTGNTEWWFKNARLTVGFIARPTAEDLHHTLRVGVVANASRMATITPWVHERFGDQVFMHSFPGVPMPDPEDTMHVLEIFASGVDKWRGLQWIAQQRGFAEDQIIAIGDSINDVSMVRSAGLSIAMGNAIEELRAAAHHTTGPNTADGVADAIDHILAGHW